MCGGGGGGGARGVCFRERGAHADNRYSHDFYDECNTL